MLRRLASVVLMSVCARALAAQQLRGVVRDSALATPIPGAVVTITDSAGTVARRTIADGAGQFSLAIPPRAAKVRVIRIGYRPSEVAIPASGVASFDLAMTRIPPMLNTVRVSDQELCPGSDDRGPAFQLWEQARAGLLAAVVAREANPAQATSLVFKRQLAVGDQMVKHSETRANSGQTSRPFLASAPPAVFARTGYMAEDPGGRTYFAPDADVLLDESFAVTHCFHLQTADNTHQNQIGLAFTPAPGRDAGVDVRGVVWMDRDVPAVRELDFRFTELEPAALASAAGGHLEFRTMANGVSFIERWVLRLPVMEVIRTSSASTRPGDVASTRRQNRTDLRTAEIDESGGQVVAAKWGDGSAWSAPKTGITGDVTQTGTGAVAPYALVGLTGTADTTMADANGVFTLAPLIPGRYALSVIDTALSAHIGPRVSKQTVEVIRDNLTTVHLQVSPLVTALSELCHGQKQPKNSTTIVGRIALAKGERVRDSKVYTKFQADYNSGSDVAIKNNGQSALVINSIEQTSAVDGSGRFTVCGVAMDRPVSLRFNNGTGRADTTVFARTVDFSSIEWRPTLRSIAAGEPGTIGGVVVAVNSGLPVAGAEISMPALKRTATTGADGAFEFSNIPAGSYAMQIRHMGDALMFDALEVGPGADVRKTYSLVQATQLDTVRTRAGETRNVLGGANGFEQRRRGGNGTFLSDSLLRANESSRLSDLLRARSPGLKVFSYMAGEYAQSSRDQRAGKLALVNGNDKRGDLPDGCYATVYFNGTLIFDMNSSDAAQPPPSLSDYSVKQLGGVEYYPSGTATPPAFRSSTCGLLLLWGRDK